MNVTKMQFICVAKKATVIERRTVTKIDGIFHQCKN